MQKKREAEEGEEESKRKTEEERTQRKNKKNDFILFYLTLIQRAPTIIYIQLHYIQHPPSSWGWKHSQLE